MSNTVSLWGEISSNYIKASDLTKEQVTAVYYMIKRQMAVEGHAQDVVEYCDQLLDELDAQRDNN